MRAVKGASVVVFNFPVTGENIHGAFTNFGTKASQNLAALFNSVDFYFFIPIV